MDLEQLIERVKEMDRKGIPVPVDVIGMLHREGIVYSDLFKEEEETA